MKTNIILQGDALTKLKELPDESINCVMTSPPYWALRDYGTDVEIIWDGDENCKHDFDLKEIQTGTQHWNQGGKVIPNKERKIHDGKLEKVGFCNKCGSWKGQLGLEPTFDLYIKHLCDIFDEVKRVLRKDGTCWVNLGDTYYTKSGSGFLNDNLTKDDKQVLRSGLNKANELREGGQLPSKTLTLIPMRFAIEMVNRGWILRNNIIWYKPNCMPTSVKDRFTVDFEYVFFFVKNKKYWFEQQLEEFANSTLERVKYGYGGKMESGNYSIQLEGAKKFSKNVLEGKNKGRNKRTVWRICPKSFKESHFAVYPEELCETPIKAGCPKFVCEKCGKPKVKILEHNKISDVGEDLLETKKTPYSIQERKGFVKVRKLPDIKYFAIALTKERVQLKYSIEKIESILDSQAPHHWFSGESFPSVNDWQRLKELGFMLPEFDKQLTKEYYKPAEKQNLDYSEKGYKQTCDCNAKFTGGIVLDPFFGAGTTGLVALKQNKKFIGIELNSEYIEIAKKRLKPYMEQRKL